jgi:hypothetical protein
VAAAWSMTLPATGLVRSPEEGTAQRVFNRASLFPPLAFAATAIFFAAQAAI